MKSVHEKIKHRCGSCNETFSKKGNLKRHIKLVHDKINKSIDLHINGKAKHREIVQRNVGTTCGYCGKDFAKNLKRHIQAIHKKLKHSCESATKS